MGTPEINVVSRPTGQRDVLRLECDPIPTVRVGLIGLSERGSDAIRRCMAIIGIEIKAICDLNPDFVKNGQRILHAHNKPLADEYTTAEGWKSVCEREDIDLVYICTDWLSHASIAVFAMENKKHVAIEVPAAMTVSDCWKLVDTAERMRRHCMMLENCCYDFFELNVLNMVQQGLFGELIHADGAYIHDLRSRNFALNEKGEHQGIWRLKYNETHTGNPYPTHGLGPICQAMNIHRGDKMNYLVSMSTQEFSTTEYTTHVFGKNSIQARTKYALGDMNTTLIRTEKGRTIKIQHDISNPRPYCRIHALTGTKGFAQKDPNECIALYPNAHEFLDKEAFDKLMEKYEHPIIKELGESARKIAGHRAMSYIMDARLIYCLQKGYPLDMDVYDAAEWSCLTELTELSVLNGSTPIQIPDFTRGSWDELKTVEFTKTEKDI